MAPSTITEDYYKILEVEHDAPLGLIVTSYKRLALKLHPDRNRNLNSTSAFQLLAQAYETLKDESKRRSYDLIYPSIRRTYSSHPTKPHPTSTFPPQQDVNHEATQIAALQRKKEERRARWWPMKNAIDSTIFDQQRTIRRLEQEIKNLESIAAAEAATEAQEKSWATWFLSPLTKKVKVCEEEKARQDRGKQERRIEKDMKERRLDSVKTALKREETQLKKMKEEVDAADRQDDWLIRQIQAGITARENQKRQEKERLEREKLAEFWQQQREQRAREEQKAAEAVRKKYADMQAAEERRWKEERSTRETCKSHCSHNGWWPKVQGRAACPECYDSWTYLLQCQHCKMKACPKCQAAIRPHVPRTHRRAPPRMRTPSPDYGWY